MAPLRIHTCLTASVMLIALCLGVPRPALAGRSVLLIGPTIPYKAVSPAPDLASMVGKILVGRGSIVMQIVNISSLVQSGTVTVLEGSETANFMAMYVGPGSYTSRMMANQKFSGCGNQKIVTVSSTGATPVTQNAPATFTVQPKNYVRISFDYLTWDTVRAGDTGIYPLFTPFLEVKVDQDRGALRAIYTPTSNYYNPGGNPQCDTSVSIPGCTIDVNCFNWFTYQVGSQLVLNGDRAF